MLIVTRESVPISKACVLASVSRRTIYNWMHKGKVEYVRTAGGSIRIYTDSLFKPAGDQQHRQASMVGTSGQ